MSGFSVNAEISTTVKECIADLVKRGRRNSDIKAMKIKLEPPEGNEIEADKVSEHSPNISRYGRAHKPKISEDFLPTDKKVGAILGFSPRKSATPSPNATPKKKEKGKSLGEVSKDYRTPRKRRFQLKLTNSLVPKSEIDEDAVETFPVREFKQVKEETKFSKTFEATENQNVETFPAREFEQVKEETKFSKTFKATENQNMETAKESDCVTRLSPDTTTPVGDEVPINSVPTTSSVDIASPFGNSDTSDCGWKPGDLAWARVGGHPFWPCMIAVELQTGLYTKTKRVGRGFTAQRSLHVQFFGDNGRHCWISTNCVIRFEGREGLQNFADKVLSEMRKKDKKFSTAFIIRPSAKSAWDCAVREAEEALPKTREERIRYFLEMFPPEIKREDNDHRNDIIERTLKKRKRSNSDSDEMPMKQVKVEPDSTLENKIKNTGGVDKQSALSPDRKKIVSLSSLDRKKIKRVNQRKKKKKKEDNIGFEVYCEKFSQRVSDDHPELNAHEVKSLLAKLWSELDSSEKSKYESKSMAEQKGKEESSSSSEDDEVDDDEESNDNASHSTRESSPSLPVLKKGGGLFRGTRHEKVCQLCLKPGNTVKCKGPCLGIFHIDCVKNPPQIKVEVEESENKRGRKKLNKTISAKLKLKSEPQNASRNVKGSSETEKSSEEAADGEKDLSDKEDGKAKSESDDSSESYDSGQFRCKDCSENRPPVCFVCGLESDPKTNNSTRIKCGVGHCGKFYHSECLKQWPQASYNGSVSKKQNTNSNKGANARDSILTCPQHVCHTCTSDDPRNATMRFNHDRLVKCVMCPTAYHTGNYCVPAGSEILTGCQIVCSKHYAPPPRVNHHVNAAWCFICAVGGSLICCDLCPTSFHAECLKITPPEDGYICEDCDTGRFPLYGEVVWVKLGSYRWWPAQILFPNQIPDNVANLPHLRGEFAVRFFGSHDHYWVNRGRVFLYQEGDTGHRSAKKTSVDGVFQTALAEALGAHKKMKIERSLREAEARPGMASET